MGHHQLVEFLVQLAEHRSPKPAVEGSTPSELASIRLAITLAQTICPCSSAWQSNSPVRRWSSVQIETLGTRNRTTSCSSGWPRTRAIQVRRRGFESRTRRHPQTCSRHGRHSHHVIKKSRSGGAWSSPRVSYARDRQFKSVLRNHQHRPFAKLD